MSKGIFLIMCEDHVTPTRLELLQEWVAGV
jgi:hypothetical protein